MCLYVIVTNCWVHSRQGSVMGRELSLMQDPDCPFCSGKELLRGCLHPKLGGQDWENRVWRGRDA